MTRISPATQAAVAEVEARLASRVPGLVLELRPATEAGDAGAALSTRPLVLVGTDASGVLPAAALALVIESAACEIDGLLRCAEVEARADQRAREIDVLRCEHREIVEHNLREHDRVVALERQDALRLEDLVRDRTIELERTNRQLATASSLKDRFLWHVSHEVRTPLHGLMGNLDLLRETTLGGEQRELVDLAWGAAEALRTVVGDVVDFSRLEAGVLALEPVDFELRSALGSILKVMGPEDGRLGPELLCEVASDVPDRLRGDIGRIRQVLVNLVRNAIKFTAAGGEVRVGVTLAPAGEGSSAPAVAADTGLTLHVSVADTGIGIPTDKQPLVFQPFWQVDDSAARLFEGAGLGLALASRLVEKLGGRIWFESEPGRGTTFHFTAQVEDRGLGSSDVAGLPATWRGSRALLIVGSSSQRSVLTTMLARLGLDATAVTNLEAAVAELSAARAAQRPFAVTLIDIHAAPDVGPRFTEALTTEDHVAGSLVAVLPPAAAPSLARRVLGIEVDGVVVKPVLELDLVSQLRRLSAPASVPPAHAAPAASELARSPGLRVLVVEDNPINQKLAARMLAKRGYHVTLASNGREALEAFEDACFDLVLMDVQMPEVDGLEATRRIRHRERQEGGHVPIIAMTASSMDGDRDQCLAAGMDHYLPKPVTAAALFATIDRTVAGPH